MAKRKGMQPGSTKVYGYVRVSTVAQADDGESLEVQQRKLEGWALQVGYSLTTVYVERGVSGSRPLEARPQGKLLWAAVQPGDTVVASKLDRMFRSASDALRVLAYFKRQGIHLVLLDLGTDSVTGNGISALIFTILAAVATFERERIVERVTETKRALRAKDRFLGGTRPFGYQIRERDGEKVLMPVAAEQQAIQTIRELAQQGRSLRAISRETMARHPVRLSHVTVERVLSEG